MRKFNSLLVILFALFAVFAITACSESSDDDGGSTEPYDDPKEEAAEAFGLTTDDLVQPFYSDSDDLSTGREMTFVAAEPWETEVFLSSTESVSSATRSEESWVTVDPSSGPAGENTVVIKITDGEVQDRTASIKIVSGESEVTIEIEQQKLTEAEATYESGTLVSGVINEYKYTRYDQYDGEVVRDYYLTYDEQGRLTKVICSEDGGVTSYVDYELEYDGNTLIASYFSTPDVVVGLDEVPYVDYDDDTLIESYSSTSDVVIDGDTGEVYTSEKEKVEDECQLNENGYITSAGEGVFEYDSDGHLVKMYDVEAPDDSPQSFVWDAGNLVSTYCDQDTTVATYTKYENIANIDINMLIVEYLWLYPDFPIVNDLFGKRSDYLVSTATDCYPSENYEREYKVTYEFEGDRVVKATLANDTGKDTEVWEFSYED